MQSTASSSSSFSPKSLRNVRLTNHSSKRSVASGKTTSKASSMCTVGSRTHNGLKKSVRFKNSLSSWLNESASDPSKVIGVRIHSQPNIFYDLFTTRLKHPSYILRADMCIPRTRFIVQHRAIARQYSDLTPWDRFELVHIALRFAKEFDLLNTSLTLPVGAANVFLDDSETFYAYISIPSVFNFLRVFNLLKFDLPEWPNSRWRTPLWPRCSKEPTLERAFEKSLFMYRETYHDPEVLLAAKSVHIPPVANVRFSGNTTIEKCPSFGLFKHSYIPNLLAVVTQRGAINQSCQSRWKLLDSVYQKLSIWCNLDEVRCHLSITLAEPYQFCTISGFETLILLQFPDGVPESLLARLRRTESQKNRLTRKTTSKYQETTNTANLDTDFPETNSHNVETLISRIEGLKKVKKHEEGQQNSCDSVKITRSVVFKWRNLLSKFKSQNNATPSKARNSS